jgi:hypothetical protein
MQSRATAPQRMSADQVRHAFSEPLELWAELGGCGLVLLGLYGLSILKVLYAACACQIYKAKRGRPVDYLLIGMASAIAAFVFMSLVHFPRKIVPTFVVFNVALAWVVNEYQSSRRDGESPHRHISIFARVSWVSLWLAVLAGGCAVTPIYWQRYLAGREWAAVRPIACTGELASVEVALMEMDRVLHWNGRFLAFEGDVLLREGSNMSAIESYEKAKCTYPDPYMLENLAVAYLRLASGTSCPLVVQTEYRTETPLQALVRETQEWHCGSNLFSEPPRSELTRADCIARAIGYLTLASNILPWRLTSKWYLADVFYRIDETNRAIEYAQLVINIPMKTHTERGVELKLKAQKMLNELGVPCNDPGLVVFDIHDRSTWNEGKW